MSEELFKETMQKLKRDLQDVYIEKIRRLKAIESEIEKTAFQIGKASDESDLQRAMSQIFMGVVKVSSRVQDEFEELYNSARDLENIIFNVGTVLEFFQKGKVTNKLDLPSLMDFFTYAYSVGHVSAADLLHCLGLAVDASLKILNKKEENRSRDEDFVKVLGYYFNEDGALRYNEFVEFFQVILGRLCLENGYIDAFSKYLNLDLDRSLLVEQFGEALKQNNLRLVAQMPEESSALRVKKILKDVGNYLIEFNENSEMYSAFVRRISMVFDHEKCRKPLDLELFLGAMQTSVDISDVSIKDISVCLGMLVHQDYNAMMNKKSRYVEHHSKEVKVLMEYYNSDGSFKENEQEEVFRKTVSSLLISDGRKEDLDKLAALTPNFQYLSDALTQLLHQSNIDLKTKRAEAKILKQKQALEGVGLYYQGGKVIALPEDMYAFMNLLTDSGFDVEQRNFILKEIKRKKDAMLYDKTTVPLFGDYFNIYMTAKDLMASGILDVNDRLEMGTVFANLASTVELMAGAEEEGEKAYLENELAIEIDHLQDLNKKYTVSKNANRMRKKGN